MPPTYNCGYKLIGNSLTCPLPVSNLEPLVDSKHSKHNLIPTRLPKADASALSDIELDHSAIGAEPFTAGSRSNIYDIEIIETIVCSSCNCAVDLAHPSKAL